jgi:hypothetical protein
MTFSQSGNWPDSLGPGMRAAVFEAGHMVGQELVKRVKTGMTSGSKSGRIYSHPRGGTYQASASPGEYSAVVSGNLIGSIAYRMQQAGYLSFYATSGHAGYQEWGTSKMGPRENLKRAIDESDGAIKSILHMIIMRAIP